MMPGEDGFETCRKLKESQITVVIPVVFVSALGETANKIRGFSVGAVDYVTKPYDVLSLSQDIYGYFCADLSGHNLCSSLATSSFKALISQSSDLVHSPKEALSTVNRVLEKVLPLEIYLTAVYILLNRKKKTVKIASAGHPSIIYLPLSGSPEILSLVGDVLGMFENVSMDLLEMDVSSGDRFYN